MQVLAAYRIDENSLTKLKYFLVNLIEPVISVFALTISNDCFLALKNAKK
jgi:hypothetical protein